MPPFNACRISDQSVIMNVLIWNCRGALKPNFQDHIRELFRNHNPAILVVMETHIGGVRAREITDRLPFENAIHTDTIGLVGGLWMLWNSERVDVTPLANTEQEIHAIVKVIAGDFNEPLMGEDKFGGRPVSGDQNTAFYHVSTPVRRKRNQILAIKDLTREWIHEEMGIREFIRRGFEGVYTSSHLSSSWFNPLVSQLQAKLSEEEKMSISGAASEEEIKSAFWSLKPFKAPGPDGLHASFFQRFWLVVGKSVVEEIGKIFSERKMPEYLNRTHITLIPKIQELETLGNYCLISLCNTVYKVVTKIIVVRVRPFLDKLISPLQSAFVPRRKSVDNAIIVQEIIHSRSKKRGNVGYMALKIDLEKAYDKLEWSFIREMMIRARFPEDQMEPVKVSQSGPVFSHMFFADDLVLFAKADAINCSTIRDVLDAFCKISGQTVSEAKSRVFFSPNMDRDSRESFCDILGFHSTQSLRKYLGFPIRHTGSSSQDFNYILDRVKNKLAGWKANLLSLAGRTVLIQASSSAIPAYVM
nr:uncharacterized protein LOC112007645 [Quercus suber]